jgi:hypothetical protein
MIVFHVMTRVRLAQGINLLNASHVNLVYYYRSHQVRHNAYLIVIREIFQIQLTDNAALAQIIVMNAAQQDVHNA